ncbi:MAG: chitobiase/beta-hexosaminidase C-terminal domain-containing protein [Lachnospiraceae bacterium]|nr:chitobiase/beta-hexosaminidase C-terminal domain-containing protein [Lachnospiraceae bacterium]
MICPKCGNELAEGNMYCEVCGEEIYIVPDFEPEIENSISDVLSNVAEEINPTVEKPDNDAVSGDTHDMFMDLEGNGTDQRSSDPLRKDDSIVVSKRMFITVIGILTGIVIVLLTAIIIYISHDNSRSYQIKKGDEAYALRDYNKAIQYYEKAYRLEETDPLVIYKIADCYYAMGNIDKTIDAYETIIIRSNTETEAWIDVINLLDEDKNYDEISSLLENYAPDTIRNEYIEYLSKEPGFSLEEGDYNEVKELELVPITEGSIYYTLDGSEPGSDCLLYTEPIVLRNGRYIVSAIFVNKYGVCSEVVSKIYDVTSDAPDVPVISLDEGAYNVPQLIKVTAPAGAEVHYTTDGTVPGPNSAIYTDPIAIPMGDSWYRFVAISRSGNLSDEVSRHYNLTVDTVISEEEAINIVKNKQFEIGRVIDLEGTVEGGAGRYMYVFSEMRYVQNRTMYFISEYYQEGTIRMVTGNIFTVDVYDGSTYQAVLGKDNTYTLHTY